MSSLASIMLPIDRLGLKRMQSWPSRAWSCSELERGADQVVMTCPSEEVLNMQQELLSETSDLSAAQIEELLKAWNAN